MPRSCVLLLQCVVLMGLVVMASSFDYVDAPVQLLNVSKDHANFELIDEGLEFLKSIKAPFAIIALGGAAKSGKSSLLNSILNVSNAIGFDVSPGYKPGTLGIFFWGRPLQLIVDGQNTTVIFMDTEGLGSNENPAAYDQKLCLLTVLIASDFYYNVLNAIMKDNVNLLHSAVQLYSLFQRDKLAPPFPHLFWVVQNYQFDLRGQSPEDYLTWALEPKEIPASGEASDDIIHFNEVVSALKSFPVSPAPHIMLLDSPKQGVPSRELVRYGWADFDAAFQLQLTQLKQLMLSRIHTKQFSGGPIEGAFLAQLITETIVPGLNRIDTIIPEYLRQLAEDLLKKCFDQYTLNMTKFARLPVRESQLIGQHKISANQSLETFATNCTGGLGRSQNRECYEVLNERVLSEKEILIRRNFDENQRRCQKLLDEEWNALLRLRLCETTCDIREYEIAKVEHKRRYEAGCLLEPVDRDKEYAIFKSNRMKDNDERFAVKCAQRCFKSVVGTLGVFTIIIYLIGKLFSLCGPPHICNQIVVVCLLCIIVSILSYMDFVPVLPWPTLAFFLAQLPIRLFGAAGQYLYKVPIWLEQASSSVTQLEITRQTIQWLSPAAKKISSRAVDFLASINWDDVVKDRVVLYATGAATSILVLVLTLRCCCCTRRSIKQPRAFRVRALD